jgi:hypothetical protein
VAILIGGVLRHPLEQEAGRRKRERPPPGAQQRTIEQDGAFSHCTYMFSATDKL